MRNTYRALAVLLGVAALMTLLVSVAPAQSDAEIQRVTQVLRGSQYLLSYREGGAVYGTYFTLNVHFCPSGRYVTFGHSEKQTVLDNRQINNWEERGQWTVLRYQGVVGVRSVSQSGEVNFVPVRIQDNGQPWISRELTVRPRGRANCR